MIRDELSLLPAFLAVAAVCRHRDSSDVTGNRACWMVAESPVSKASRNLR